MQLTREELQQFAGKTGIHNHPASSAFSPADLRSFVVSNAIEWRVVGPQTTFIMRRPPGGWPSNALEVIDGLEKSLFAKSYHRLKVGNTRADTTRRAVYLISELFAARTGARFTFIAETP